mgnify:CR=1 FL=1
MQEHYRANSLFYEQSDNTIMVQYTQCKCIIRSHVIELFLDIMLIQWKNVCRNVICKTISKQNYIRITVDIVVVLKY